MLDNREKSFAAGYIANKGNAFQAALAAGYSRNTSKYAYEWLTETLSNSTKKRHLPFKPELKTYIGEQLEKIESEEIAGAIADAKEIMEYATSAMRGEQKEPILVSCGNGKQEVQYVGLSAKDRLKAAELMAKLCGLLKNAVDLSGVVPVVISGGDDLED